MKKLSNKHKKIISTVCAAVFWILVWQIAASAYGMDFVLPSPWTTFTVLLENITKPEFWSAIFFSVGRIILGFVLSGALGILLALVSVKIKLVKILLDPFCSVLRAVPVASFIILVLVMFSSENIAAIISFLMGFPLVYSSVSKGIDVAPEQLLEVADLFKMGFFRRLRYIYLPHLRPYISNALAVSVGLCFKSGVAAEVIGYPVGSVGAQMYLSKVYFDMPALFSYTAVIVVISVICEKLISFLLKNKEKEITV